MHGFGAAGAVRHLSLPKDRTRSDSCFEKRFLLSWHVSALVTHPTIVVATSTFSPYLSVCTFPTDRCDPCNTIGPHATYATSLLIRFLCRDRIIADFTFIIMALFNRFYSSCRRRDSRAESRTQQPVLLLWGAFDGNVCRGRRACGRSASGTPRTACVSCWMICLRCTTATASESPPTRFSTAQSPAICHAGPQGIVLGGQGCACHVCHHRGGNSAQRAQIRSIGAAAQRTSRSHFFRSELHQGNKRAFASFLLPNHPGQDKDGGHADCCVYKLFADAQ